MLTSKNKNMVEIIESLIILGHQDAAQQIQDASETCNSEMDALALALKTLSVEKTKRESIASSNVQRFRNRSTSVGSLTFQNESWKWII